MRQVLWILGFSFLFCTILRSPVTPWPHGAYRKSEPGQVQRRGFLEKLLKSIAADFFLASACLGTFGSSLLNFLNFIVWLGSLMRVQYPKCAYGPYCKLNPIKNGVYILVESLFIIVIKKNGSNWASISIGNAWWLLLLKVFGNITYDGFFIQYIE